MKILYQFKKNKSLESSKKSTLEKEKLEKKHSRIYKKTSEHEYANMINDLSINFDDISSSGGTSITKQSDVSKISNILQNKNKKIFRGGKMNNKLEE